jgi:sigma-E factor negative regulatory protein RseA
MTDQNKEMKMRLSMLLDGELRAGDNPRLLDKIENEDELKSVWGRYHLIGEVMRGSEGLLADREFAARVSAAVREAPTALAPGRAKSGASSRQRLVHLAMAATLAAVAVFVGKSLNDNAEGLSGAAQVADASRAQDRDGPAQADKAAEAQFNDYLLMHNETAYLAGSAGMLPYVRLMGAGQDQ